MKIYTHFLLFVMSLVSAYAEAPGEQESSSISSSNASYDGAKLVLNGNVTLDHSLGKMAAESATLERESHNTEFPFSLIQLHREVSIQLKQGAKLLCDQAHLDFIALKGHFKPKEGSKITYSDYFKKKKSFQIHSNQAEVTFLQKKEGGATLYQVDSLQAEGDVAIEPAPQCTVFADKAFYKSASTQKQGEGIITASGKDADSPCRMVRGNDEARAKQVIVDLVHSKMMLEAPVGHFAADTGAVRFSALEGIWNWTKNLFTMKGNVSIQSSSIGSLSTNDTLEVLHKEEAGKRVLQEIRSSGTTLLSYDRSAVTCYGKVIVDHEKAVATLSSPSSDQQIHYQEGDLVLFADGATIEYSPEEKGAQISSLTLRGNIRAHDLNQVALADRLHYHPETHTLILAATSGKKVLLVNEKDALRISAPEVHITRDVETGKNVVKGIGNMQFTFTLEEQNLLQKIFSKGPNAQSTETR